MKATEEQILQRISEGKTASEMMDEFGYKTDSFIYTVAKKHNVKVTKPCEKKAVIVAKMRSEGKLVSEIASELGMTKGGVQSLIKRNSIPLKAKTEIRVCGICGKEFETSEHSNKKYCCIECQRKANRTPQGELDESKAIEALEKHSDWEYIGGYTGSEGSMIIRHKPCGFTTRKSSISVRHTNGKPNGLRCLLCEQRERAQKEKQRRRSIEAKQFKTHLKPIKYKTYSFKECCVCGAFFIPDTSRQVVCSDECRRVRTNHQWSMKEERRKQALTSESNQINVRSVFERDNGICWLCGEPCDIDADPNDNRYPSVDHVIPIARGGLDEWSNVRLAHRLCNSIKWAHIIEDPDAVLTSLRSGQ